MVVRMDACPLATRSKLAPTLHRDHGCSRSRVTTIGSASRPSPACTSLTFLHCNHILFTMSYDSYQLAEVIPPFFDDDLPVDSRKCRLLGPTALVSSGGSPVVGHVSLFLSQIRSYKLLWVFLSSFLSSISGTGNPPNVLGEYGPFDSVNQP